MAQHLFLQPRQRLVGSSNRFCTAVGIAAEDGPGTGTVWFRAIRKRDGKTAEPFMWIDRAEIPALIKFLGTQK